MFKANTICIFSGKNFNPEKLEKTLNIKFDKKDNT